MAVDSPANYIEAARPHVEKDQIINPKDHDIIENRINAHAVFWITMMQVAKNTGDFSRYKSSLLSHNSAYATQYFCRRITRKILTR